MEQLEEERRQKEERDLLELLDTIALDEAYFNSKDLQNKGKDVHPTAKQRKTVQDESSKIKFVTGTRRKAGAAIDESLDSEEIDLKAKPRVFICIGAVNKYEPGRIRQIIFINRVYNESNFNSNMEQITSFENSIDDF